MLSTKTGRGERGLPTRFFLISLMMAVLIGALIFPALGGIDDGSERAAPGAGAVMQMLSRLRTELQGLEQFEIPALGEQLEALISMLEDLLADVPVGHEEAQAQPVRDEIIKLDLMLHRLVFTLNRLEERALSVAPEPRGGEKTDAMAELGAWVDGYVAGITSQMGRDQARQFELTARGLLGEVRGYLRAREGGKVGEKPLQPRLMIFTERLEDLLAKLDLLIIRSFVGPHVEKTLEQTQ